MAKITVNETEITIIEIDEKDYISLTDMVKSIENGLALIEKWLRNKNTIEFLGIWEEMYNPNFNSPEFEGIKNAAGLNRFILSVKQWIGKTNSIGIEADVLNVALFGITAKQWRDTNPDLIGNIRDYATINQLICLSNMENLNAVLINKGLSQSERIKELNHIAIQQMSVLEKIENKKFLKT